MTDTNISVKAAFEQDYKKLVIARSEALAKVAEIEAGLRRREYLDTVINNEWAIKIFCPNECEGGITFATRVFRAVYKGKAVLVAVQPDLTLSTVSFVNGRYQFDDNDLGWAIGGGDRVHCEGDYSDGILSVEMDIGHLVVEGLTAAEATAVMEISSKSKSS